MNSWLKAATCCATRNSSVTRISDASEVSLTRLMKVLDSGGTETRAAILSVPKGQWEAGHTIGMSRHQTLVRIILPQAARVSVPPLSNTFISLVKDTSLASLMLVTELFRVAQQVAAFSQEFMLLYLEAAVIYWIICLVLASGQSALELSLIHI